MLHRLGSRRPVAVPYSSAYDSETVLYGSVVDLGHKPARSRKAVAVKADAVANGVQLVRRAARMLASSAANMQAEFAFERGKTPL